MLYIVLGSDAQPALVLRIFAFKLCVNERAKYPSRCEKIVINRRVSMEMGSADISTQRGRTVGGGGGTKC